MEPNVTVGGIMRREGEKYVATVSGLRGYGKNFYGK